MIGLCFLWIVIFVVFLMFCGGGDGNGMLNLFIFNDVIVFILDILVVLDFGELDVIVDLDINDEDKILCVMNVDLFVGLVKGGEIVIVEGNVFNINGMIVIFGDFMVLDVFVLDGK